MTELRIPLGELPEGKARRFEGPPGGVCVVRLGDAVFALGDRCSHAEVSLAEGDLDPDARTIECWKHGSAFSLLDGSPQSLPATKPVAVYPVVIAGGEVVVSFS